MRVILIESPFQFVQAIEYQNQFPVAKNLYLVRYNNIERNNQQLNAVKELFAVSPTFSIFTGVRILRFAYLPLVAIVLSISSEVVIGDSNSIFYRLLAILISRKRLIFLDDGVATLLSRRPKYGKRYSIFSESADIKNELLVTKSKLEGVDLTTADIIVGGKLVEEGICSSEVYFDLLSRMIEKFKDSNSKLFYIAHRGESEQNLERLREKFSFDIIRPKLPIELIALEIEASPLRVASVLSTAMYTLAEIYPRAAFYVFPIEEKDIVSRRDSIIQLFKEMKRNDKFLYVRD